MRILGINHLGLAPKDPERARWFLTEVLGLSLTGEELVASQKTSTAFFTSGDDSQGYPSRLEVLTNQEGEHGPIAAYLEKKGGGIHHVALTVDDVASAIAHMKEKGVRTLSDEPQPGAHNTQVVFIHPKEAGGLLIELVQPAKAAKSS